jgi:hypothetical protein
MAVEKIKIKAEWTKISKQEAKQNGECIEKELENKQDKIKSNS